MHQAGSLGHRGGGAGPPLHELPRAAADFTQIRTIRTLQQPIYRRYPKSQLPVSSPGHSLAIPAAWAPLPSRGWGQSLPSSPALVRHRRAQLLREGGSLQGCALMRIVKPIRGAGKGCRAVCPSVSSGRLVLS